MVKVSVIVATYKRTASLSEALLSLSRQNYRDFEIIVVDDNAFDATSRRVEEIVEFFRISNPEICINLLKNRENIGSARSRNAGIQACRGKYVTFLDDDDVYLPDKIKNQLEYMEMRGCDYSATDLLLYNESGRVVGKRIRENITDTTNADMLLKYHLMYHITGTDTLMFKREYLVKIGGFAPIDVGDEFYLIMRAIEQGGSFGYLHECNVKALVHSGDAGLSGGDGKIKGENDLYKYKKQFFSRLSHKERRYIRMRHYAVIAFAELKRKRYARFVFNAAIAFLSAPIASVRLFSEIGR